MSREPIPDWLEAYGLEERELDQAYSSLSQADRARLKKSIAQLFSFYSEHGVRQRCCETHWSEGLSSIELLRPVPWALALVGPEIDSPAQLLAALLPPLSLGVEPCLAIRTAAGPPWPPALLCALELAGVERIYSLPAEHLPPLLDELRSSGSGVILSLGSTQASEPGGRGPRFCSLYPPRCLGLWSDGTTSWDEEAILFAHPQVELLHSGGSISSGRSLGVAGPGEWDAFLEQDVDGLFVPLSLMRSALEGHFRVLGPGQEGNWVWPELTRDVFLERRLAWYEQVPGS